MKANGYGTKLRRGLAGTGAALCLLAGHVDSSRAATERLVFEDPGIVRVVEGTECRTYDGCGTGDKLFGKFEPCGFVFGERSSSIPAYADRATVVLNGVRARYTRGDHHVTRIGVELKDIRVENREVRWAPRLEFVEDSGAKRNVCYTYTTVAWNSSVIDARVIPTGEYLSLPDASSDVDTQELASGNLRPDDGVAIAPAGYSFSYDRRGLNKDHHLLQLAYRLGQDGGGGVEGEARWQARGIIKDKKNRKQKFSSLASVLAGESVGVLPADFEVERKGSCTGLIRNCIGGSAPYTGTRSEYHEVAVPDHDYAIPMLTGFDVSYPDADQHVRQVGAWLDDIEFDLSSRHVAYRVNTSLYDNDQKPGFSSSYGVTILTLDRVRDPNFKPADPEPTVSSTWEPLYDRPGRDYRNFSTSSATPRVCMEACIADAKCSAWTYVKAGVQGKRARCWLKSSIPAARLNGDTTSGVVYTVEPDTDRPGGDYRGFPMSRRGTPNDCRIECLKEQRCRAWTYVDAGVQGSAPRCWLKDRVPRDRANSRTTSGVVG